MKSKVFCIGFHKTATSSLTIALQLLGYRVTGPNGVHNKNIKNEVYEMAYKLVDHYDAFQDNPWPIIYKELDHRYPNSKFILTTRNVDKWIASVVRHFGKTSTPMREWIYGIGYPEGNESTYILRYQKHNKEVMEYFEGRDRDFLILDITAGDGWDKLCPFLGHEIPSGNNQFPNIGKAKDREAPLLNKILKKMKYY